MAELEDVLNEISSYEWENDLARIVCGSLVSLSNMIEDLSDADLNERLREPRKFEIFECFYEPLLYYKSKHNLPPNCPEDLSEQENDESISVLPLISGSENKSLGELLRYGKTPKVSIKELFGFVLSVLYIGGFNFSSLVLSVMSFKSFIDRLKIPVCQHNWRPIFVTALILSDKLWDDSCAKSGDLTRIVGFVSPRVMRYLELVFCVELDWRLLCDLKVIRNFISEITRTELDPALIDKVINSETYQSYCWEGIGESSLGKNHSDPEKLKKKDANHSNSDCNSERLGLDHKNIQISPPFTLQSHNSCTMQQPPQVPHVRTGPPTAENYLLGKPPPSIDKSGASCHYYGLNSIGKYNRPTLQMAGFPKGGNPSLQRSFYYSPARSQASADSGSKPNLSNLIGGGRTVTQLPCHNLLNPQNPGISFHRNNLRSLAQNPNLQNKFTSPGKSYGQNFGAAPEPQKERGRAPSCSTLNYPVSRMSPNLCLPKNGPSPAIEAAAPHRNFIKRSSSEHSRLRPSIVPVGSSDTPNTTLTRENSFFSAARNTVSSAFTSISRTFGLYKASENNSLSSNISLPRQGGNSRPESSHQKNQLTSLDTKIGTNNPHPVQTKNQAHLQVKVPNVSNEDPRPQVDNCSIPLNPCEQHPLLSQKSQNSYSKSNQRNLSVPPNSNPVAPHHNPTQEKEQNHIIMRALSTERKSQSLSSTQGPVQSSHFASLKLPNPQIQVPNNPKLHKNPSLLRPPTSTAAPVQGFGAHRLHANFGRHPHGRGPSQMTHVGGARSPPSVHAVAGGGSFGFGRSQPLVQMRLGGRDSSVGSHRPREVSLNRGSADPSQVGGGMLENLLNRFSKQSQDSGLFSAKQNMSPSSLGNIINPIGSSFGGGGGGGPSSLGRVGLSGRSKVPSFSLASQARVGGAGGGAFGLAFRS